MGNGARVTMTSQGHILSGGIRSHDGGLCLGCAKRVRWDWPHRMSHNDKWESDQQ